MVDSTDIQQRVWFALRVTYQRELAVLADLKEQGIECFVPMAERMLIRNGKRIIKTVAAVSNLIFVKLSPDEMRNFKQTTTLPIRYIMDAATGKPIIVPERQMRVFMEVASHDKDDIIYVDPQLPKLKAGTKVRVIGGVFAGVEGVFVRLRGDRRVVVTIPGVAAVATHFIHPSLVQPISDNE